MEILITKKRAEKLETELCVKLGFCSMRERYDKIIEELPSELTKVVNDIFFAEGLNPELAERKLWRSVRDFIVEAHHES